ncbi:hypothetical protein F4677DRAFT_440704 [Hypoxylon crocopeplum]|nr:hypothetical protein F4677DRAFT_440704 [Hypoxylon crocopeplum]
MSYNRWRTTGYEDDRRRSSYGYESYKPTAERSRSRDRSRDMESNERDSRASTDARDPRTPRSPRGNRRDADAARSLHIDTKMTDAPRQPASSANSPASAAPSTRPTPTEPAVDRLAKLNNISSTIVKPSIPTIPSIPKAKDPKIQDVFEVVCRWNETLQERILLQLRKDKTLQEDRRRQSEVTKISNKVDDYAPFSEFQRRFNETGKAEHDSVQRHMAELDQKYAEELEKVVSSITSHTVKPQVETAAQSASISALEAKFADLERRASEQQKQISDAQSQIQTLLSDRDTATRTLDALGKEISTLKAECKVLKSENSALTLQIANIDSKKVNDDVDRLSKDLQSFVARAGDVEGKVSTIMEKVGDLDMETYNEILEAWTDHDFKHKVFSNEQGITDLRQDFQSFRDSAASKFDKNDSLIQEAQKTIEGLESSRSAGLQPGNQSSGNQPAQQSLIDEKLNYFSKVMQKTISDSGDACAEMVDEVRDRVDAIEATVKTSSKDTYMATQLGHLDQAIAKQAADVKFLRIRTESLEGQRLGLRIDRIDVGLADVEKELRNCRQAYANVAAVNSQTTMQSLKPTFDDIRRRFEAVELATRTLDSQWSNLSSKQMAERILQQLDPYGQRNETRIFSLENEVVQLREKLAQVKQDLSGVLSDTKKLADIAKVPPSNEKRPASPASPADDPAKRRRLFANGQHACIPISQQHASQWQS